METIVTVRLYDKMRMIGAAKYKQKYQKTEFHYFTTTVAMLFLFLVSWYLKASSFVDI